MIPKKDIIKNRIIRFNFFSEQDSGKFLNLAIKKGLKPNTLAKNVIYMWLNEQKE